MRNQGYGALTLENMCQRMGKTRGSFYHHFRDMDAFIGQLLVHWQTLQTQAVIEKTELEVNPKARITVLDETVRALDHRLDRIVRAWSLRDPRAAAALTVVDRLRMEYLRKLFRDNGTSGELANVLAELEYTAFLGAQQRFDDLNCAEARQLADRLREVLHHYAKTPIQPLG